MMRSLSLSLPPSLPLSLSFSLLSCSLEDYHLDDRDTHAEASAGLLGSAAETHTQPVDDFGHSLFAG